MADDRQVPAAEEPPIDAVGQPGEHAEPARPPDAAASEPERWRARAGVRPMLPGAPPEEEAPTQEYVAGDERPWWLPAVIGIIALILLGMLGVGIWLIQRAREPQPVPVPSGSAGRPSPTLSPSAAPASAATSAPASPAPSASPAPRVPVPGVVGMSLEDASSALAEAGLSARVEERVAGAVPAGTVLAATPPPGTFVAVGSSVTLVVAVAPPTSQPPSASPTGAPPSPVR